MIHSSTRGLHRKRLALLLALLLALGVMVAACGGDDSSSSEPAAPTEPEAPAEEPAEPEAPAEEPAEPAEEPAEPAEPTEAPTGEPLIIGAPIALSGGVSFYDVPILNTANIAVEEINAAGGILGRPVEIVTADQATDPAQAGTAAEQVIEQGAEILLVACDFDQAQGAARVATENGLLSIHCAGGDLAGYDGLGDLHFNAYPSSVPEGAALAQYAIDQGWNNVFMLEDTLIAYNTDLCKFFQTSFEGAGGTIVGKEQFVQDDASVANQVSAMQQTDADAVVVCSFATGAASAIKQIRDVSDIPVLTGVAQDGVLWTEGISDPSNIFVATLADSSGNDEDETRNELFAKYQETYGEPAPHGLAMQGYQIMYILRDAIEAAGTTEGEAVAAALEEFENKIYLGDSFTYTDTCHISPRPMTVVQIQGGVLSFAAKPVPEVLFEPAPC